MTYSHGVTASLLRLVIKMERRAWVPPISVSIFSICPVPKVKLYLFVFTPHVPLFFFPCRNFRDIVLKFAFITNSPPLINQFQTVASRKHFLYLTFL